jgi:hypothetical protein
LPATQKLTLAQKKATASAVFKDFARLLDGKKKAVCFTTPGLKCFAIL